jgi:hypothetical protein
MMARRCCLGLSFFMHRERPRRSSLGELVAWNSLALCCQSNLRGPRLPHEEVLPAMRGAAEVQRF